MMRIIWPRPSDLDSSRRRCAHERKQKTRAAVEHQRHAVAILNVGGMHCHAQQQAERIDDDMALATRDLLARIEALRVEQGPPFLRALGAACPRGLR